MEKSLEGVGSLGSHVGIWGAWCGQSCIEVLISSLVDLQEPSFRASECSYQLSCCTTGSSQWQNASEKFQAHQALSIIVQAPLKSQLKPSEVGFASEVGEDSDLRFYVSDWDPRKRGCVLPDSVSSDSRSWFPAFSAEVPKGWHGHTGTHSRRKGCIPLRQGNLRHFDRFCMLRQCTEVASPSFRCTERAR